MKINKLFIENFQSIKEGAWIDLKPITILVGPNSSGKSAIYDALYLLEQITASKPDKALIKDLLNRWIRIDERHDINRLDRPRGSGELHRMDKHENERVGKIGIEFEGRVTVTRLSKFVASKMGSTKPKEKSSNEDVTSMNLNLPAWGTKENSGKVVKITNDNFGSRRDPRSSLFLMFYAPWCTHCTEVKPTFALASTGGNAGKDVDFKGTVFGAVDCDMEEQLCQDFNIQKFPTFAYMPGNVKDVVPDEYDGERDAEVMVDFVLSKLIGANVPDSFFEEA